MTRPTPDRTARVLQQALTATVVSTVLTIPWVGFGPLVVLVGGIAATGLLLRSLESAARGGPRGC